MLKSYSRKRVRDVGLHASWDALPDAFFDRLGIPKADLKAAQLGLEGHIVVPTDASYDEDRALRNPVFNPQPAAIVFCVVESDVAIALTLARTSGQPFTVRSGGHCNAGFSAATGVLIDVQGLSCITVDATNRVATVGTGCMFGPLNKSLQSYGLHVPGGECDDVCVGGFVQGGGLGFTSVTFGMNCDNVIELKVMLHDGSIVVANQTTNYDLWWAMRGGTGGNFGVLLSVTYTLYPLTTVSGWALAWPLSSAADVAAATDVMMLLQQSYMRGSAYAPNLNIQVLTVYQTIFDPAQPPASTPFPVFMVRGLWVGDPGEAGQAMAPLQKMPGCVTQWTMTDTYINVINALLSNPQDQPLITSMPFLDKASRYVATELTAQQWTSILNLYLTTPNSLSYMYFEFYGGAIASYPRDSSAFIHRDALFDAVLDVCWYLDADRAPAEAFLREWIDLMETVWNGEVYQNYVSMNVPNYMSNYWGDAVFGLYQVKQKYDPLDAFSFPQMVRNPWPGNAGIGPEMPLPAGLGAALLQPIAYTVAPGITATATYGKGG